MKHMGDNLTGEGEGDDEQILIDLTLIPANVDKVAFTVTIYDSDARRQNFGQVSNSFIRIVDETTGQELIRYDLGEDFSIETAVVVGELYRHGGEWKFNAIGALAFFTFAGLVLGEGLKECGDRRQAGLTFPTQTMKTALYIEGGLTCQLICRKGRK